MIRVLLAPDSFKGTLHAQEVCDIIAQAFQDQCPDDNIRITKLPAADGGEGLCAALEEFIGGKWKSAKVQGPYGGSVTAKYLMLPNQTAVIEIASCVGLPLVGHQKNPAQTTTYGVGQLLLDAQQNGAKQVLLGLGGSATNDCGMGMAQALGYRFIGDQGWPLPGIGASLEKVTRIISPKKRWTLPVVAACDVTNPLFGKQGAAYVYAPQKGADAEMVRQLDRGLVSMAKVMQKDLGLEVAHMPGAGAAGGLGAGVLAFLQGEICSGVDMVLDALDFNTHLQQADAVITGEGCFDRQSLQGKVVYGVLRRAKQKQVPVYILCGASRRMQIDLEAQGIRAVYACGPADRSMEQLRKVCREELYATACQLVQAWFCPDRYA